MFRLFDLSSLPSQEAVCVVVHLMKFSVSSFLLLNTKGKQKSIIG